LHSRVVNRHFLARWLVDRIATFLAAEHHVLDADIGKRTAHHDLVVSATRSIRVKVDRPYLVRDQVAARRTVALNRTGRRNVIGGDRIEEQTEDARIYDVSDGGRHHFEALEIWGVLDIGRARIPIIGEAWASLAHRLPLLVALEDIAVAL